MWDAIVGEHGQGAGVDVGEAAVRGAVEAGPDVGGEDLGALVEFDLLALKHSRVAEVGEVFDQDIDQSSGGVIGSSNDVGRLTGEVGVKDGASFTEDGDALVEEGNRFRGGRAEDVSEC